MESPFDLNAPQTVSDLTQDWNGQGITLNHVEENPRHFRTKRELRRYANEKGFALGALGDV
jgi:hypothetical protein